ncbi:class F sortase [Pseudarthrobacter enclensis]|uniref:class F sortase n=1 Tax=Pseudarthrobacter enclensis TaxID=993070 RepID=UPI0036A8FFA9
MPTQHRRPLRRSLNRTDLAILLCGAMAALGITFGTPLLQQTPSPAVVHANAAASPDRTQAPAAVGAPAPENPTAAPAQPATAPVPGTASPAAAGPALPETSAPVRITYPGADFDVPVHSLEPDTAAQESRTIIPPETKDGYWLTPFGTPGRTSTNTTYVVGHSWDGADAPFNHLSSAARAGDRFTVETGTGSITYRVDSVDTYVKSNLKDSPVWDMVPNRLVLISCFTQDPWGKNVVVTASPAGP